MKIALVRPNYRTHLITPPLGIGYLSAYLKKNGFDVKVIDGLNLGLTNQEIVQRCQEADVVGISILTDYYLESVDLAKKLKQAGKIVVLGGVHPSILPEDGLKDSGADYVVKGEGEVTLLKLTQALAKGNHLVDIPGLYYLSQKNFFKREFIKNLDSLPFIDWQELNPRTYQKAPHGALIKNFPVAPIITTRGCPYNCSFCSSPAFWQSTIRFRSPENVVEEIEYLIKNFGVKEIHFEDDNLTLKRDHIVSICQLIIKRNLKISWATPNGIRADKVDKGLLQLMKKSGLYYIVFGIESGNQEILDKINKKETLDDIEKAVKAAHDLDIMTQGFFIFGLPGETKQTVKKTINFAKKIPLDRAQFLLLDLLPGSELWQEHKDEVEIDYSKRSYQDTSWVPKTVSAEYLKKMQPKAFRSFFFRPGPMFSLIKYFKPVQLKFVINRLKDFRIIGKE